MIILNSTGKSLEVFLAAAVSSTQPDYVASYVDLTTTTYTPGSADGTTNSTSIVTAVAAPAVSTQRQIKFISIMNRDTAAAGVTVQVNSGGTARKIASVSLASCASLFYTDGKGFHVLSSGATL